MRGREKLNGNEQQGKKSKNDVFLHLYRARMLNNGWRDIALGV